MKNAIYIVLLVLAMLFGCDRGPGAGAPRKGVPGNEVSKMGKIDKTDQEWKQCLTAEEFRILREKGTERAFTGKYWDNTAPGIYKCAGCGAELFSSDTKFKSGTGWPSFYKPANSENITTADDNSLFMKRTEVLCSKCDGHLGHVFNDGPQPTGLRYCINGNALDFDPNDNDPNAK